MSKLCLFSLFFSNPHDTPLSTRQNYALFSSTFGQIWSILGWEKTPPNPQNELPDFKCHFWTVFWSCFEIITPHLVHFTSQKQGQKWHPLKPGLYSRWVISKHLVKEQHLQKLVKMTTHPPSNSCQGLKSTLQDTYDDLDHFLAIFRSGLR